MTWRWTANQFKSSADGILWLRGYGREQAHPNDPACVYKKRLAGRPFLCYRFGQIEE